MHTPTANNFERFKNPAVDQALASAGRDHQPGRAEAGDRTSSRQMMYTSLPIVLLYYGGSWGMFSTKNFTGWPSASDPYTLPTPYNSALLTVVTHLTRPEAGQGERSAR